LKASVFYRISSILLVLFAAAHTLGFRQVDPRWGVRAIVDGMQSTRFDVQGFSRSYWDFFVGFGLFVSVLLLFAALVAWQLPGLSVKAPVAARNIGWGLAICFVGVTLLIWKYFFLAPLVFAVVVTVCLLIAASLSSRALPR
jgi:hypothetical protein